LKTAAGLSDGELLERISKDDEKAFQMLFERYWEEAHCLAFSKVKSREATQEIVQDLFLTFWTRRHNLRIQNFQHYLRVAIKYKAITHISQLLSRQKTFEDYSEQISVDTEETLQTIEYNDLMNALEERVKILPEKTQEVFRMSRLEGRSVSEIAGLLNLSEKAIEYHITRSRKELRLHLKDFLTLLCIGSAFLLR
jgi:RNA polymerase sigma-70 factor (ECF subfamily)